MDVTSLPVTPPLAPMLAKPAQAVPDPAKAEGGYLYEPKWDGFRCIVFKNADDVVLGSRNEKPLTRYFPEVVEAARALLPQACVLDGEIVIAQHGRLQFERLLDRIHPAESRVARLADQTPASFVAFDILALGTSSHLETPQLQRRELLEGTLSDVPAPLHVTPATRDRTVAQEWFTTYEGAGLDGVIAKPGDAAYTPGVRTLLKIKHARTSDVVVAGYRLHKNSTEDEPLLGSLLLGLHDDAGVLQHVGVAASFTRQRRAELLTELSPHRCTLDEHPWAPSDDETRRPGGVTRWNTGRDLTWVPLRPELVAEVGYDHLEGTRFRHTAQFKRWRPDKTADECTYVQLDEPVGYELDDILR